jgi:hypothetical protein
LLCPFSPPFSDSLSFPLIPTLLPLSVHETLSFSNTPFPPKTFISPPSFTVRIQRRVYEEYEMTVFIP